MRTTAPAARRSSPAGGDLLTLLAADLPGCELVRVSGTEAVVRVEGQPRFLLEVRVERRRLLTLQTTVAHVLGPRTDANGTLRLRHTGQLRRTGLDATLDGPKTDALAAVRDGLLEDGELQAASLALDFTRFVVAAVDGRWRASIELMGGSHVRTTLPPSSRYVRLSADQLRPLVTTVAVLRRRLPADDAGLPATTGGTVTDGATAATDRRHLPPSAT